MRIALPACALALALAPLAQAQTSAAYQERIRFDTCLGQIQLDASEALERAQTWRLEGGGWPAEVCEARALIELGEPEVGADILVSLAERQPVGMIDEEQSELFILAGDTRFALGLVDEAAAAYDSAPGPDAGLDPGAPRPRPPACRCRSVGDPGSRCRGPDHPRTLPGRRLALSRTIPSGSR